ncbi:MAG: YceI family protein [Armatimonadota bacterium]
MQPLLKRAAVTVIAAAGIAGLNAWSAVETRAQAPVDTAPASGPLRGTWTLDPLHSNVSFAIKHLGLAMIRGRFDEFAGTIVAEGDSPEKASVQVTIKTASIDTDIAARDEHLRSADFFDVEKFPEITFRSTRVEKARDGFVAHGPLTIKGISREVALPFRVAGPITVPQAGTRIGVETRTRLNRQEFGLTYHQVFDGVLALANDVDVAISLEAVPEKK